MKGFRKVRNQVNKRINKRIKELGLGNIQAYSEYLENHELFVHRMWQQTRQKVLRYPEVKKHFLPDAVDEIRITV